MPPNVNPIYLTRWLVYRGISGFIAGDSTTMRRNYHYTNGVIIFTHCYTPSAWRSDLEELAIPTGRQSERRRAPTRPGGTRPGTEGPSLQRRCSEASRPMPDRSHGLRPSAGCG